jgi:hypothetical protein
MIDQITVFNFDDPATGEMFKGLANGLTGMVLLKWGLVIGLVMYTLFTLVIVKQVGIMAETFEDDANGTLKLMAWVHLFMALAILVAGIVIL